MFPQPLPSLLHPRKEAFLGDPGAPRFCFVSAGMGCNVRSTLFRVSLQFSRVLHRGFFEGEKNQ
jgi:hypothetical protein